MEEVDALRSTEYLKYEQNSLPWYLGVEGRVNYYLNMFFGKPGYEILQQYLMELAVPKYNMLGWTVTESQSIQDKLLRPMVVGLACRMNYKPCVDTAKRLYAEFMNNPDKNPIHPDLRPTVYCTGVAKGGVAELEFLKGRVYHDYGDIFIARENNTLKEALPCVNMPSLIRRYLDFVLEINSTSMFEDIAERREARDTVWAYITEHWDDFMDGNETRIKKSSVLTAVTSTWNTNGDIRKFKDFMMTHNETDLAKTYASIMETIEDNKDWVETNMAAIENWLKAVNSGQSYKRMPAKRRRRRSISPNIAKHHSTARHFASKFNPYNLQ